MRRTVHGVYTSHVYEPRGRRERPVGPPRPAPTPLTPAVRPTPLTPAEPSAAGPGGRSGPRRGGAGPRPRGPAATGTRSARSRCAARPRPTGPARRAPRGPAAAASACGRGRAGASGRGEGPRRRSLVERARVQDRLRRAVTAQDHHQVADHGGLALGVELDDVLLRDPGQ